MRKKSFPFSSRTANGDKPRALGAPLAKVEAELSFSPCEKRRRKLLRGGREMSSSCNSRKNLKLEAKLVNSIQERFFQSCRALDKGLWSCRGSRWCDWRVIPAKNIEKAVIDLRTFEAKAALIVVHLNWAKG